MWRYRKVVVFAIVNVRCGSRPEPADPGHHRIMDQHPLGPADAVPRRAGATDLALRRRTDELLEHRRVLAERARLLRTDLARTRVLASGELTAGLRRLRDDARAHLERADATARRGYPEVLAVAVAELGRRYRCRTEELLAGATRRVLAGLAAASIRPADCRAPAAVCRPPTRARWPAEERLIVVGGVSAGAGLVRWCWVGGWLPPGPSVGTAVALAVGVGWWLVAARRAASERARLAHWTNEVLADTRAGLDGLFAERLLDAERRVSATLGRLGTRLDAETTAHRRRVRAGPVPSVGVASVGVDEAVR